MMTSTVFTLIPAVAVVSAVLHAAVGHCCGESNEKSASWSKAGYGVGLCHERNSA